MSESIAARRQQDFLPAAGEAIPPGSEPEICEAPSSGWSVRALSQWRLPRLLQRLALFAALIVLELLVLSTWLDTEVLNGRSGLIRIIHDWGPGAVRWMIAFSALWLTFSWGARNRCRTTPSGDLGSILPGAYWPLLVHAASLMAFGRLAFLLFRNDPPPSRPDLLAGSFVVAAILAAVSAGLLFLPLKLWFGLLRETRLAIIYAASGASGACLFGAASQSLWKATARLTFGLVAALLHPFLADLTANPASLNIGSKSFSVTIAPECSGIEGVGLMLIFATAWLCLFRTEYRFPQALLLIPGGVILIWVVNAMRITALILIGNAGAPDIAQGGFHSQAGWIGFNAVALAFTVAGRRIGWLRHRAAAASTARNPVAPYLVPFLAILAAGMVSQAASSGAFEWFYGARPLAAAVALWWFRREYARMEWRVGWRPVAIGVAVFLIWIGAERVAGGGSSPLGAALASLSPAARSVWLTARVLAAVITVPVAEELAFRGFVLRRVIAPDFESIDPRRYTIVALAVSSLLFGLLHGNRWLVGSLAGLLYAYAYVRRGRIGEAAVAHGVTNALLAAWVLWRGEWSLW